MKREEVERKDAKGGPREVPERLPERRELESATVEVLRSPGAFQADIRIVDLGDGPMVVKDFAAKPWWARWFGRVLIGHETRAYRELGRLHGIPAFLGRIDAHALAVEKVDGVELTRATGRYRDGARHFARLVEVVERLRARRFYHLDLRGRHNVFLCTDGEVVLFDLAASAWLRGGSMPVRLCERLLSWLYDDAMLKWKTLLAPQELSDEERAALGRSRFLRALWIFNLKGSWQASTAGESAGRPAAGRGKTV